MRMTMIGPSRREGGNMHRRLSCSGVDVVGSVLTTDLEARLNMGGGDLQAF